MNHRTLTRSDPNLRGVRTKYSITHNPSYAKPQEEIYVKLDSLGSTNPIDPNSLCLKFVVSKSVPEGEFFNNLAACLIQRLVVDVAGTTIYDNCWEGMFRAYTDLWLSKESRDTLTEQGLKPPKLRNINEQSSKANQILHKIYSTTKIPIGKILQNSGMICPNILQKNLNFTLTLAKSEFVLSKGEYNLSNIEIEYDIVNSRSGQLTKTISDDYSNGKFLPFRNLRWVRRTVWNKDRLLINEEIQTSQKCLNQIVMLFTKESRSGSEEFVFPGITHVNITVRGVPSSVYNTGIKTVNLLTEARKTFTGHMDPKEFFCDNMFALVVDLRCYFDNSLYGNGRNLSNEDSVITLEIQRSKSLFELNEDLKCHIFVNSDSLMVLSDRGLESLVQ